LSAEDCQNWFAHACCAIATTAGPISRDGATVGSHAATPRISHIQPLGSRLRVAIATAGPGRGRNDRAHYPRIPFAVLVPVLALHPQQHGPRIPFWTIGAGLSTVELRVIRRIRLSAT
jgi:hypothetical protein